MRSVLAAATPGAIAPTRIALLPRAHRGPDDFLGAGFATAVRKRGLAIDLELVELELAHLTDRTVLRRLRHQTILAARAAGCQTVWLAGVSLGGFVALAYA